MNRGMITLAAIVATGLASEIESQCTFTSSVPYAVSFSTITANNQLPLCWSASHLGSANVTSTNGYAAFTNTPAGTSFFYSHGIQLFPGVTYSAYIFYTSIISSSPAFYSLGVAVGASQSSVGMTPVVTTTNVGPPGSILGGTLTVSSPGIYYLGIWAASTGTASQMLKWTDAFIEIPCSFAGNSPTIAISPPSTSVCPNETFTLVASGADIYNTGTPTIVASVSSTAVYNILGTKTLTGCMTLKTYIINVKPVPQLTVVPSSTAVCPGTAVTITAQSSPTGSFAWQGGQQGSTATYSPLTQSSYSVLATAANGCTNTATISIGTRSSPTLTISSPDKLLCVGDTITLTGTGALNYTWSSTGFSGTTNPVVYTASATSTGTTHIMATGTNSDGCSGSRTYSITVDLCASVPDVKNRFLVNMYPVPASEFIVVDNLPAGKGRCMIMISDVTGQLVHAEEAVSGRSEVKLEGLSCGAHILRIYLGNELIYSRSLMVTNASK